MVEFDREVEKEKLRLQFDKEAKSRESAKLMSALLLKGATMTSKHCRKCCNPIFRQDEREFCPTCKEEKQETNPKKIDQKDVILERESNLNLEGPRIAIENKIANLTKEIEKEEDIEKITEYLSVIKKAAETLNAMDELIKK